MRLVKPILRFPEFSSDWEEKKLKDIVYINPKCNDTKPDVINYIDLESVNGNKVTDIKKIYKENAPSRAQRIAKDQDIFFQTVRPYQQNNFIYNFDIHNIVVSTGYAQIRVHQNAYYVFTLLHTYRFLTNVLMNCTGSNYPAISGTDLSSVKVIYSSDEGEQRKIGDFFSKLDRQIELEEQKLAKLEEQKKGYMKKIFSQELRFKDENGNDYPEYEEKELKELIDVRDGTHESPKPSKEGYLLVTSKNLKNSKLDFSESYFISKEDYESINQRSKVEIGDILFGMIGTIGNPILLEECGFAIKNVALLKTSNLLEKYYILNFLKSSNIAKQFYRMNAGGTQKFIALSTIRELKIDMPSSEEAIKIGNFFNKIDSLTESQSSKIKLLKERKKGFLQKMFV